jgi:hypothetical protein
VEGKPLTTIMRDSPEPHRHGDYCDELVTRLSGDKPGSGTIAFTHTGID